MKLIVIDVQKGITDERLYDFDGFIKNVTSIIDAARKNNVEVIYVQHDDGPGTGFSYGDKDFEIADQMAPKENEKIFIKTVNSCFGNNDLANYLLKLGSYNQKNSFNNLIFCYYRRSLKYVREF